MNSNDVRRARRKKMEQQNKISRDGHIAFRKGIKLEDNPHPPNSIEYGLWHRGYNTEKTLSFLHEKNIQATND